LPLIRTDPDVNAGFGMMVISRTLAIFPMATVSTIVIIPAASVARKDAARGG
jgi:hypothetical protein